MPTTVATATGSLPEAVRTIVERPSNRCGEAVTGVRRSHSSDATGL